MKNSDTLGMDCPVPLLQLKKELSSCETGEVIELRFSCPEATVDIPTFCRENNHEVLEYKKLGPEGWMIKVKK